jgi:hypothetical protein
MSMMNARTCSGIAIHRELDPGAGSKRRRRIAESNRAGDLAREESASIENPTLDGGRLVRTRAFDGQSNVFRWDRVKSEIDRPTANGPHHRLAISLETTGVGQA